MIIIMFLYFVTVVLLLVSMMRIFRIITAFFTDWKPNKCFMALQIFIFVAPVIVCGMIVLTSLDDKNIFDLSLRHLLLYSIYQALMSLVMIALLYVVTKYSLSKQAFTAKSASDLEDYLETETDLRSESDDDLGTSNSFITEDLTSHQDAVSKFGIANTTRQSTDLTTDDMTDSLILRQFMSTSHANPTHDQNFKFIYSDPNDDQPTAHGTSEVDT